MTKIQLEKRVAELEALNKKLVAGFKTGEFTYWRKKYRGVELAAEIEQPVTDHLRDLLCDQLENSTEGCDLYQILSDDRVEFQAGVKLYIVRYTYSQANGTWIEKAYRAVEVL